MLMEKAKAQHWSAGWHKNGRLFWLQYQVEFARTKQFEDKIEDKGVTIFIDPAAVMFIVGSEMDWSEDKFASSFTFKNPNEQPVVAAGKASQFLNV